jgi:uncharacterized protein (TIGR03435 family)
MWLFDLGMTAKVRPVLVVSLILTTLLSAQEKRLTFEVASIKPAKPGAGGGSVYPKPAGQGYEAEGATVRQMISVVYRLPIANIKGGPAWLDKDEWDVEAKADHAYNLDDLHQMFQNLLADEFKLKFHEETKEGPLYALTVDKSGPKMKVNDGPEDFGTPMIDGHIGGVATGKRVPMKYLCYWIKKFVLLYYDDRPVIDKTGLTGYYDFTLSYQREMPPGFDKSNWPPELLARPSIFDALRDQLGLKLEAQKGPVPYYVIDHVEKPPTN